jgi:YD repeat-containing protein
MFNVRLFLVSGLLFSLCFAPVVLAGGYVTATDPITPSFSFTTPSTTPVSSFNNSIFNSQNLISSISNNILTSLPTNDPISTVSGNNFHDETDFTIRGRNGLNYVFTRTYNSQTVASGKLGDLGYGWVHSYGMRLASNDYGACPNCTTAQAPVNHIGKTASVTFTDERGGDHNYLVTQDATHAVTPPAGEFNTLAFDTPSAGFHTLKFRNGTQYIFQAHSGVSVQVTPASIARLVAIKNAWGDQLNLTYDASAWPGLLTGVSDNLGITGRAGLTFSYYPAPNPRLKSVSDWTGQRTWNFSYDASNQLATRANPLGETLSYTYLPGHLLNQVIQPLKRNGQPVMTVFAYYQNGRGYQQTDGLGHGDLLDYDLFRKTTRVTDSLGHNRDFYYDPNGGLTRLTEADGGILMFRNQADTLRYKKNDALGYATQYSYNTANTYNTASNNGGNVSQELDALGNTITTTYGVYDQIASVTDKRSHTVATAYAAATAATAGACGDYAGRPQTTKLGSLSGSPNVLLGSFCWNPDATLSYSRRYQNAAHYQDTRLTYQTGSNGLLVSQQQIVGQPSGITITKTFTYDTLGRKLTETLQRRASPTVAAPISLTTTYIYDALDRVTQVTDSLGNQAVNSYDANGEPWQVTHRYLKTDGTFDTRNIVTRTYDAAERVATETDALGNAATYGYDAADNLIAVTDVNGHIAKAEYDAMHRKTAVTDATGYRAVTTYNQRGDVIAVTNANGEKQQFEYDPLGRKTADIDPLGNITQYQYDANGNLTCLIDANGHTQTTPPDPTYQLLNSDSCTVSNTYDELNRLTKTKDAQSAATLYSYDYEGHRLSVTDAASKAWSFGYDDLGRLSSETDHSGNTLSYHSQWGHIANGARSCLLPLVEHQDPVLVS